MLRSLLLLLVLLALPAALPAADGALEPVARIAAAAESAFASPDGDVVASAKIDPRLRLPACEQGLAARAHDRATAEVACAGGAGWRLFVPVRVQRSGTVLVLRQPLGAGATIDASMVSEERRELGQLAQGALIGRDALSSMRTRRALAAGAVLASADLEPVPVVRRGQAVTLVARSGALEVRAPGKALADAAAGQRLAVEATGSRRVVQGIARSADQVEVAL